MTSTTVMSADRQSLLAIASRGHIEELESAWLDSVADPGPAAEYLAIVAALPPETYRSAAPSLLDTLLDSYKEKGRHADLIAVARELLELRAARTDDLVPLVRDAIQTLYGNEEWYDLFMTLANFEGTAEFAESLRRFEQLLSLLPGRVVFHRSGWGEGLVTSVDVPKESFSVKFRQDGILRDMPFTSGLDVLSSLADHDLRTRILTDLEGLQEEAKSAPSMLVRAVARLGKNRAAAKDVKEWLCGPVIEPKSWTSWWRKAKAAAIEDPWIAVDNPQRPVFVLRQRALTPEEELVAAMDRADGLGGLLGVVRGPMSLDPQEELMTLMLDRLGTEAGLTEGESGAMTIRRPLDCDTPEAAAQWAESVLLLLKSERLPAEAAHDAIDALISDELPFVEVAAELPSAHVRREFLEVFIAARPTLWSDAVISRLHELPSGLLGPVSDKLVAGGRGAALANRFGIFLMGPSRQPDATIALAKRFAAGKFDDIEGSPSVVDVASGLLRLAETQAPKAERGDKKAKPLMKSLLELIGTGKKGIVDEFVEEGSRADLEAALSVFARVKSMPDTLVANVVARVTKRFPDLAPRDEVPFWEQRAIFCTQAGIRAYEAEYRVLLDEKIPENSRDIGRAASYGDLSENFEWTAAIEQQRQLTEKAAAMEAELRLAQEIEDQELDDTIVSPGMRVEYTENGESKAVTILGPWDHGEDVISYRAPLAAGMLGASAGDTLTVELPSGPSEVIVTGITRVIG